MIKNTKESLKKNKDPNTISVSIFIDHSKSRKKKKKKKPFTMIKASVNHLPMQHKHIYKENTRLKMFLEKQSGINPAKNKMAPFA